MTDRERHITHARDHREHDDREREDPGDHATVLLQREDARADEIREPLPLIFLEEGVDLRERLHDRIAKALRAFDALLSAFGRTRLAEGSALDRVSERGDGATLIDLALRALGLQLVEDAREVGRLLFGQIELVREEAERATNAEVSASAVEEVGRSGRTMMMWAVSVSVSVSAVAPEEAFTAFRTTTRTRKEAISFATTGVFPPRKKRRMHVLCLQTRRGYLAPDGVNERGRLASRFDERSARSIRCKGP